MKKIILVSVYLFTVSLLSSQERKVLDIKKLSESSFVEMTEGKLSLQFFKALNGTPIKGAKVVMAGIGSFNTDGEGKVQFEIPEDPFAQIPVSVRMRGFTDTDFTLEMKAGTLLPFLNRFSISPTIPLEHMRVVLDWGKNPQDLDAHLEKKNEEKYHISYRFMKKTSDGVVAKLDLDDTNGFGPETITVTSISYNGEYDYYIHDYSNRNRNNSDKLSRSQAEVKVYGEGRLLHHFKVPQNKKGQTWKVFKMKNAKVVPVNTLETN